MYNRGGGGRIPALSPIQEVDERVSYLHHLSRGVQEQREGVEAAWRSVLFPQTVLDKMVQAEQQMSKLQRGLCKRSVCVNACDKYTVLYINRYTII